MRDEILDEFLDFIQDETHAILLSSHITSDLEKAADYIVYLHAGRVALQGEKDVLLDTYGRLACSRAQLAAVDPAFLVGSRVGQFGCEALIRNRRDFRRRYPELTVDPVTLEEIMVLTGKEMRANDRHGLQRFSRAAQAVVVLSVFHRAVYGAGRSQSLSVRDPARHVALIGLFLPMSSIGYDDQARWEKFAVATPAGRRGVVAGKYLLPFCPSPRPVRWCWR